MKPKDIKTIKILRDIGAFKAGKEYTPVFRDDSNFYIKEGIFRMRQNGVFANAKIKKLTVRANG